MLKKALRYFLLMLLVWFAYLMAIYPRPLFDKALSTVVYDDENNLLGARTANDGQWRFNEIDSVPYKFEQCLLLYEDRRFYSHPGIDPVSIAGAVRDNIINKKKRGGSTLTMQVMRLALQNQHRSLFSKLEEMSLAFILELRYSKKKLLKIYSSNAPFGGNVVGLEAACWRYFHKPPHLLTWAEAATLAVLPNAPSLIHPGKNREVLKNKRNFLLKKLMQSNSIDSATYEVSLLEDIPEKPKPLPQAAPHLVDYLYGTNKKGDRYKTTIKNEIQTIVNEIGNYYNELNIQNNINNAGIVVVDNANGNVIAYYGNHTEGKNGKVDMIQAKRSSGSILKPLLYCAMLDEGKMTSGELLKDIPISINGYAPLNFDKNYRGGLPANEALQRSLNIPFVLMLKDYGIEKAIHKFRKLGLKTIDRTANHYGLTLILGGAEVSLWELCGVYASMARTLNEFNTNQSKYDVFAFHEPRILNQSEDSKLSFETNFFKAGSIYETFDALKNLERPNEEGLWQEFNSTRHIAWKTGTSFGHKDAWAIGVDAKYTIGVWIGNADGSPRTNLTGIYAAAPVLFDVFNRLPDHKWFDIPYDDMEKKLICNSSGAIAGPNCEVVDTVFMALSTAGTKPCIFHKAYHVTCDEQYRIFKECYNLEEIVEKSYFELPAEILAYYRNYNPGYVEVPDFHPLCLNMAFGSKSHEFAIIYPAAFTKILQPKDITGKQQTAIFQASHNDKNAALHWHIDDKYIGTTHEYHSMKTTTEKGKHKLTIMDDYGNHQERYYEVI